MATAIGRRISICVQQNFLDSVAPSITSMAGPANGTYGLSENLDFVATFSEAVTVSGTPRIQLTIGSSTVYATYLSGSGTTQLTFRYTVQSGDSDNDGIAATSPMQLNGGTIKDAALNAASLGFTPPTLTGVLVSTALPLVTRGIIFGTDFTQGIDPQVVYSKIDNNTISAHSGVMGYDETSAYDPSFVSDGMEFSDTDQIQYINQGSDFATAFASKVFSIHTRLKTSNSAGMRLYPIQTFGSGTLFTISSYAGFISIANTAGSFESLKGGYTIANNTWQSVSVTCDGTTVRWYINGVQVHTTGTSGTLSGGVHMNISFSEIGTPTTATLRLITFHDVCHTPTEVADQHAYMAYRAS